MFINRDTETVLSFIEKFNGNIDVNEKNKLAKSYWFARILYDRFGQFLEDAWKYIYFDDNKYRFLCKIENDFYDIYGIQKIDYPISSLFEICQINIDLYTELWNIVMMRWCR